MQPADRERYQTNLQAEVDGVALYRALAEIEAGSELATVYSRMADAEERHAEIWRAKLRETGGVELPERPGWRTRTLIALARRFGPGFILPTVTQREQADSERYRDQPEARSVRMAADERSHARLFRAIGEQTTGLSGGSVARWPGWKVGIARAAATRCGRPSLAPMTDSSPMPVWSWGSQAPS